MMPSLSLSSSSSSSSSVSASIRVDKATSELLVGPDWAMNLEICDICNSNHWLAKDVVKEVKRRLQHKNPKVQLLTLTLLETMVKNCGEYIHFHIAERKLLDEMIKIVKKKTDIHVRDKILVLLDSWQEAFGGPGGNYSQYFWACDELRRLGVQFPQRSQHSAPIITPPATHHSRVAEVGFGMPANSSRRLDEAMASEVEGLSLSTLESMRNVLELLDDMLQAVNPSDRMVVKDEVIVDLVDRCRAYQKKLMQMITTTVDEDLLAQGLEMNDSLQSVLAKHDAIASGAPLPNHKTFGVRPSEPVDSGLKASEPRDKNSATNANSSAPAAPMARDQVNEEEEEDEFAQLARRHSKAQAATSTTSGATDDAASSSGSSNALVLVDPPAPESAAANTSKEQDLIDLLSIVLTTSSPSSETLQAPVSVSAQSTFQASLNSYVVPWAQPESQQPVQSLPQFQSQGQLQTQYQPVQQPSQPNYSQFSSSYPPPPWETTYGYNYNQHPGPNPYMYPTPQGNTNHSSLQNPNSIQNPPYLNHPTYSTAQAAPNSSSPMPGIRTLQHVNSFQNPPPAMNGNLHSPSQPTMNRPSRPPTQAVQSLEHVSSFPARASNGLAMNGSTLVTNGGSGGNPSGQKPFIPSYRLFEDLNVFGSSEGKLKSGPYSSASGNPSQNMIAGRR